MRGDAASWTHALRHSEARSCEKRSPSLTFVKHVVELETLLKILDLNWSGCSTTPAPDTTKALRDRRLKKVTEELGITQASVPLQLRQFQKPRFRAFCGLYILCPEQILRQLHRHERPSRSRLVIEVLDLSHSVQVFV